MKELRQITVIGLGLLGGSVALAIKSFLPNVKVIGFSHRAATRKKARQMEVANCISDNQADSVVGSDLVILATPIFTFEDIFRDIKSSLKEGTIVTDVGSTKTLPHRWAAKRLPKSVHYIGSHPIAGSEQRGVEFSRDDLFVNANCIITTKKGTNREAVSLLKGFWTKTGCRTITMTPAEHDKIYASVSHLPHITAASLLNSNSDELLKYSGKGFLDTSRVASGPSNIWVDIVMTNQKNCARGINKLIKELEKFEKVIESGDHDKLHKLLESARNKRAKLIKDKLRKKELL